MEPSCPLYFPLYPPDHLLPGLKEYLGDPTPLLPALEHRLPTDSSNGWTKKPVQETSNSGLRNQLVVGSRKLVFLHSTPSKWCRIKMGRSSGGKEKVGWSKKKEKGSEGDYRSKDKEATCVDGGVLVGSSFIITQIR